MVFPWSTGILCEGQGQRFDGAGDGDGERDGPAPRLCPPIQRASSAVVGSGSGVLPEFPIRPCVASRKSLGIFVPLSIPVVATDLGPSSDGFLVSLFAFPSDRSVSQA